MDKITEALKQALDFISRLKFADAEPEPELVMAAIREALAEQDKQEPKKWVDLTNEEYEMLCQGNAPMNIRVRTVAMALKHKNQGD